MRLVHVSEEADIKIFEPRVPKRNDLDKNVGLVWAINEECLPTFISSSVIILYLCGSKFLT